MTLATLLDSQNAEVVWLVEIKAHVATATDISFDTTNDRITTAALGNFADLPALSHIVVSGSASNDGTYTVESSTATTIDVAENLTTEAAGDEVTIYTVRYVGTSTFVAGSTDSVDPHRIYEGRIVSGPTFDRSWFHQDNLGGSSTANFGAVEILNLDGGLDDLVKHSRSIDGIDQTIRLGTHGDDLGTGMGTYTVTAESLQPSEDGGTIVLQLRGKERRAFKPLMDSTRRYWGIGLGIEGDGSTATSKATIPDSAALRPQLSGSDGWLYVSAAVKFDVAPTSNQMIVQKGAGLAASVLEYDLLATSAGSFRFRVVENDGGTGTVRNVSASTAIVAGTLYRVDGVWNSDDDELRLYVNGELENTTSWSGSPYTSRTNGIVILQDGAAGSKMDGVVTDVRIGAGTTLADAPTGDDIATWWRQELDIEDLPDWISGYWRFNDGTGTTGANEVLGGDDATLGSSGIWANLYEGEPAMSGLPKPVCFGHDYVAPVLIDSKNLTYQVHDGQVRGIGIVTEGGDALTSGLDITSTDISFSGNTITLGATGLQTLDLYGPLNGQQVVVSGSVSNDGTHTLTRQASFATVTTSTTFTTESAGASVRLRFQAAGAGTPDYTVDHARGTFTLQSQPTKPLIARCRGFVDETRTPKYPAKPGDIAQAILEVYGGFTTAEIDTASVSSFDTSNGVATFFGRSYGAEDVGLNDVLDDLVGSVGGSWGCRLDNGKFEFVQRTAPTGTADLELTTREIFEIRRVAAVPAITSKKVLWLRNPHGGLTEEQITGNATTIGTDLLNFFLRHPWVEAEAVESDAVNASHPLPNPGADVPSWFDTRGPAQTEAQRLYDMDSVDREIFWCVVNLSAHDLDMRSAIVQVTDSDFATLASGKKFRPIRILTDGTSDEVQLWLWG